MKGKITSPQTLCQCFAKPTFGPVTSKAISEDSTGTGKEPIYFEEPSDGFGEEPSDAVLLGKENSWILSVTVTACDCHKEICMGLV